MSDADFMRHALLLGERNLGLTAPNPSVGCVIVRDGILLGRGATAKGGRPHAEVQALLEAGDAKGATAYVTLEPCAHIGKTPPCALALVKAGVSRVVIGTLDPDKRVSGKGVKILREHGLKVDVGNLESEAKALHKGHIMRVTHNRPFVTLKIALSKDGFLAPLHNERIQISGAKAWAKVQMMRVFSDAILVGAKTAVIDKPLLNVRLQGLENRSPKRFILGATETGLGAGYTFIRHKNLNQALNDLAASGITTLLVEGGAEISRAFIASGMVDELVLIRSKKVILGEGKTPFDAFPSFELAENEDLGEDSLERYHP